MAKMTVLQMVQNILSATDGDEVNSISDTTESMQVARVVEETFYEQFSNRVVPEEQELIQLDGLADTDHPNYMKIPDNVSTINLIKYDTLADGPGTYKDITYLTPDEFLRQVAMQLQADDAVVITDFNGPKMSIETLRDPQYWTSFDDSYIIFDAYNSLNDTTMQASKSLCWGQKEVTFSLTDDYVAPLDANLFPLFLAEAKSTCFVNQRQTPNPKEEQKSKRQAQRSQKFLWKAKQRQLKGYDTPNYGRPLS